MVHSFYRSATPSGENTIVLEQIDSLRQAGHEVRLISLSTDEQRKQTLYSIRSAWKVVSGRGLYPLDEIELFGPDIIHVHNLFPNFGTEWLERVRAPIVVTLHNFRPLCANGLLFRDGQTCFDCPDGRPLAAVVHRCYHDSSFSSIPLAIRNARGLSRNELLVNAAAIICLSQAASEIYVKYGVDPAKIHVVPNSIAAPGIRRGKKHNDRWAAVGRLTPEKGFRELIEAWPAQVGLDVIGDGPPDALPEHLPPLVRHLPSMPRDKLLTELAGYVGLVFPSVSMEVQPTLVIEAMALGLPIVSRAGNAGADLVRVNRSGGVYEFDARLADTLAEVTRNSSIYGANGLAAFEREFHGDVWLRRIEEVYRIC